MTWRNPSVILALCLIATVALAPTVAAATPSCSDVTDGDAVFVPEAGAYGDVVGTTVEVWEESNGVAGLQKVSCTDGGTTVGADAHVGTVDGLGTLSDITGAVWDIAKRICIDNVCLA